MKRFLATSAALLLAEPAQAVDYVACEAMQKSAARINASWGEARGNASTTLKGRHCQELGHKKYDSAWFDCMSAHTPSNAEIDAELVAIRDQYTPKLKQVNDDYAKAGCI